MLQDIGGTLHEILGRLGLLLVSLHTAMATLGNALLIVKNGLDTHLQLFGSIRLVKHLLDGNEQFLGFLSSPCSQTLLIKPPEEYAQDC